MTTPEVPERPKKKRPVIFAVRIGEQVTRIEDLPLVYVDKIAKDHDLSWLEIVGNPAGDLAAAEAIVRAVAEHTGATVAELLSVRELMTFFTTVPDDVAQVDYDAGEDTDDSDPFASSGNATSTVG